MKRTETPAEAHYHVSYLHAHCVWFKLGEVCVIALTQFPISSSLFFFPNMFKQASLDGVVLDISFWMKLIWFSVCCNVVMLFLFLYVIWAKPMRPYSACLFTKDWKSVYRTYCFVYVALVEEELCTRYARYILKTSFCPLYFHAVKCNCNLS